MTALLLGLVFGLGIVVLYAGWRPRPEPLALALARLDERRTPRDHGPESSIANWDVRLGTVILNRVGPMAQAAQRARQNLRVIGRTPEEQAARSGLYALLGLFLGPWYSFVVILAGGRSPGAVAGGLTIAGAAYGLITPWVSIRRTAARRRSSFLLALAAWCDMLAMSLAAGRGIEQAVTTASLAGEGWAFAHLRVALSAGHLRGDAPWTALEELGSDLGIADLQELASTITMAGEDGAAVREAVAAKAHTIRERITSDMERAAERATAEMGLPTVSVAFGFLVFLGYPALLALSQSF